MIPGPRPLLGIVGGMGPLASAAFLATVYRENRPEREQDAPRCLLLSDPSVPDRTEAILDGDTAELARRLGASIECLLALGADRVVIACFTIHRVLGELPDALRSKVVSLVDLVVEELLAEPEGVPRVLLATTGAYAGGVFTGHPRWPEAAGAVRELGAQDREALHGLLYRLKRGESPDLAVPRVREIEERYGARGSIFGCTELHLLQPHLDDTHRRFVVDPLMTVAERIGEVGPA